MAKQKIPKERLGEKHPQLGRPPLPADRARSQRIVSFVTPAEMHALKEQADAGGISVSAMVHKILNATLME